MLEFILRSFNCLAECESSLWMWGRKTLMSAVTWHKLHSHWLLRRRQDDCRLWRQQQGFCLVCHWCYYYCCCCSARSGPGNCYSGTEWNCPASVPPTSSTARPSPAPSSSPCPGHSSDQNCIHKSTLTAKWSSAGFTELKSCPVFTADIHLVCAHVLPLGVPLDQITTLKVWRLQVDGGRGPGFLTAACLLCRKKSAHRTVCSSSPLVSSARCRPKQQLFCRGWWNEANLKKACKSSLHTNDILNWF